MNKHQKKEVTFAVYIHINFKTISIKWAEIPAAVNAAFGSWAHPEGQQLSDDEWRSESSS